MELTFGVCSIMSGQVLKFLKGGECSPKAGDGLQAQIRKELTNVMSAKNLSFLLGAGCSSLKNEGGEEIGIPTMGALANEYAKLPTDEALEESHIKELNEYFSINVHDPEQDLEKLLERLFAAQVLPSDHCPTDALQKAIDHLISFIFDKVISAKGRNIRKIYESFYRRILFREQSLPRPWVFTTNYDLLSERALDALGIPFCNGFSGGLTRRFNPSTFKLTLARELDVSANRWTAVDNFIYLCKLHGSISWVRDANQGLWPFKEVHPDTNPSSNHVMIYPTPAKTGQSLGSPYSDLFREFQGRIVREQSVLLVMGYSFSDEHINNIIYQALTIPSFRLVIFANPHQVNSEIQKLRDLEDPRIWIIGGGQEEHFFKNVVENFLPEEPEEKIESAIKAILSKSTGD